MKSLKKKKSKQKSKQYPSDKMSRTLPVMHEMNYRIEFQTAIRGHHIYKDV